MQARDLEQINSCFLYSPLSLRNEKQSNLLCIFYFLIAELSPRKKTSNQEPKSVNYNELLNYEFLDIKEKEFIDSFSNLVKELKALGKIYKNKKSDFPLEEKDLKSLREKLNIVREKSSLIGLYPLTEIFNTVISMMDSMKRKDYSDRFMDEFMPQNDFAPSERLYVARPHDDEKEEEQQSRNNTQTFNANEMNENTKYRNAEFSNQSATTAFVMFPLANVDVALGIAFIFVCEKIYSTAKDVFKYFSSNKNGLFGNKSRSEQGSAAEGFESTNSSPAVMIGRKSF